MWVIRLHQTLNLPVIATCHCHRKLSPALSLSATMAQSPDGLKFLDLWKDATRKYEDDTKIKFATHALAHCNNPDAVLDALDRDLQGFKDYRDKKERLRKWLKPMLHLIGSLSGTAGEAAGVVRTTFLACFSVLSAPC
jgi:hypothetical protein